MANERASTRGCPSLEVWAAYLDGNLSSEVRRQMDQHRQVCDQCQDRLIELEGAMRDGEERQRETPPHLLAQARGIGKGWRAGRWYAYAAALLVGAAGLGWWALEWRGPQGTGPQVALLEEAPPEPFDKLGFATPVMPSKGTVNALVVFAQFADEADKGEGIPAYAGDLFNPDREGSLTHFFRTMSYGQLQIQATVLPKRYTSDEPADFYLAADAVTRGRFNLFVKDILKKVDAEVDLGQFDNNGPDGVPNSGDDDRKVDYLFVMMRSMPRYFIKDRASAQAGLGFLRLKSRDDRAPGGKQIYIQGQRYDGIIGAEGSWHTTVGIMAHEFAHSMGLPDLYDSSFQKEPDQDLADDGAGIGRWGLMGRGTLGWQADGTYDGPNPLCAWSREQLGWIGRDNDRLVLVERDSSDFRLADLPVVAWEEFVLSHRQVHMAHALLGRRQGPASRPLAGLGLPRMGDEALGFAGEDGLQTRGDFAAGYVYKIYLPSDDPDAVGDYRPYLLVERQTRQAHYYNRNLPGEGVLVWHIDPLAQDNDDEARKLVDLICADGAQENGRYRLGMLDDMDRWSRDSAYARDQGGSLGDAGDLFDGDQFRQLVLELTTAAEPLVVEINRAGADLRTSFTLPWAQASVPVAVATAVEWADEGPEYQLLANYPNPFNPRTTISYQLASRQPVRLVVYNNLGQVVRTLVDREQEAGIYQAVWDGRDEGGREAASGVYLVRLQAGAEYAQTRQMALVR
ncbi:MAG: T9SS type A sorting domain-containing protein [Candidatus Latescibacteria bacterium]|nr:T9SS type A sorting domain-containing protein [Candidatus Latescibacterota bacterium]